MIEDTGTHKKSGKFGIRRLASDVIAYSIGQGILLLLGGIQAFIIPKYLSVEEYGYWQIFILYASYVGILHLGFINGVHIRWAGKELDEISAEVKTAFRFLLLQQIIIIIPLGLALYFVPQQTFQQIGVLLLIYAFICNIVGFFLWTCLAIRKFKMLAIINVTRGATCLLIIIVLFTLGFLDYQYAIFALLASYLLILIVFTLLFRKYLRGIKNSISSLYAYGKANINTGIFAYLGSVTLVLIMTIDRLMVSSFFTIELFAIYAFALMIATVVYNFVGAISQVYFPNLSAMTEDQRIKAYRLGKPAIIFSWAVFLALYFPLSRLIEFYLPDYVSGLTIMSIFLCTVGFGSLIQILHTSYYFVYQKQKQYFLWGITTLAITALLNLLAIKVWGTLESVAIVTLISFGIWYIMNELSLRSVAGQTKKELCRDMLILVSYIAAFWLAFSLSDWFIAQMLIYIGFFCLISWLLLGSKVRETVGVIKRNNIFQRENK